jgi:K+-sensing histidine kinase KdpD
MWGLHTPQRAAPPDQRPLVLVVVDDDMFGSLALQKAGGRRGHGLGLYLVKLVAQAHGGDVVVRDREGGGASFVMTCPRAGNS